MKQRFFFGVFLIVCMTLITACGGNGNTSTNNNGGTSSASPTSTGNVRDVNVAVTDTKIEPSKVTFSANLPYDFTITNNGHSAHDFIIRRRVEGPAPGGQTNEGILHIIPSTQLTPGAVVHFTYSFPQASIQSTLQLEEHLAGKNEPAGPLLPIQGSHSGLFPDPSSILSML
ncbi:MAG: hypothetical protein NVS4B11_05660 [Ktedonobacteraceae bacterium]